MATKTSIPPVVSWMIDERASFVGLPKKGIGALPLVHPIIVETPLYSASEASSMVYQDSRSLSSRATYALPSEPNETPRMRAPVDAAGTKRSNKPTRMQRSAH